MAYAQRMPSGQWRGVYRDLDGKKRYKAAGGGKNSWPTKKLALNWARAQEADVRRGRWHDPQLGKELYRDWVEIWWGTHTVEFRTERSDRSRIDTHLIPKWGEKALSEISHTAVGAWVKSLSKSGLSGWTVGRIHTLLKESLDLAVREGKLVVNPAVGVDLPAKPPGKETFYTREQVDAIRSHMGTLDAFVVWMLVWTGLRWGELVGLHAANIDLKNGLVHVQHTMVEEGSTRFIKAYPKGRAKRAIPIAPRLLPNLLEWTVNLGGEKSCGFEHADRGDRCPGGLLIVPENVSGRAPACLSRHTWGPQHWAPARRLVPGAPYGTPHDLRHTFASWMLQVGMSLEELARLMGHASLSTTQKYAHWQPDNFERARRAMAEASSLSSEAGSEAEPRAIEGHSVHSGE